MFQSNPSHRLVTTAFALSALFFGTTLPESTTSPLDASASPPSITAVLPDKAYNWQAVTITITGTNFASTPTITLNNIPLLDVTFIGTSTLTATVPANLPNSSYTIIVTNPDTQSASLADAFTVLVSGDGTLDWWQTTTSMSTAREGHAVVAVNNYLYAMGGYAGGCISSVERAQINPDGSLGVWQIATPMTTPRYRLAAVAVGNYIYAIGGSDCVSSDYGLTSVERTTVNPDGTLSSWQTMASTVIPRSRVAAVTANGYLYAIGGYNSSSYLTSVERSLINPDGSLGPWTLTNPTNRARSDHAAVAVGGYLYALGGDGSPALYSVERAAVSADGSIGSWQEVGGMVENRRHFAAVAMGGYIYALGGDSGAYGSNSVERATIYPNGYVYWEMWPIHPMTTPRPGLAAVVANGFIYALGGFGNLSSVEKAAINPLSLTSLSPSAIAAGQSTAITITGKNFLPVPTLRLGNSITLTTNFVSPTTLTVTVPASLSSGWYEATLTNSHGFISEPQQLWVGYFIYLPLVMRPNSN